MLYTVLVVLQVIISIMLILVVLIQQGRGADMGAMFGGSSQTVFGAAGAGSFLGKLTYGFAAAFFAIALVLARMGDAHAGGGKSLIPTEETAATTAEKPVAPEAIPAVPTEPAPSAAAPSAAAPTAPAPEAGSNVTPPPAPAAEAAPAEAAPAPAPSAAPEAPKTP